ncbi:MAG: tRNA (adenosine(37)-N6)-dimethylallyltransferase MiaA [Bacteroidales bacterium]|nr:tRNA (adenosine(37)-N6)-dimethylallyltransferase MiaA [Bacteroidales bacterium]MCF8388753.1 tRNA (adenosine(37)-N6)-dimethylallyltransferase MiaA [Bacteroidales bacterium]MCF8396847.1 tRNA (adenosine(37)-N6)-dimethylallyltransferase MiaA [Bacteroidales bacterium]
MITILGPTATGKTSIAARLASQLDGEVISADSRQVYKNMDIGTGKDLNEYVVNGKAIPYHLIDIVEPGYEYNVYEFQRDFRKAYHNILKRGKTPILCGGTGLYIESVLLGYDLVKVPENITLRDSLRNNTHEELVELLKSKAKLHNTSDIQDRKRLIRAIEINQYYKDHPNKVKNYFEAIPSLVYGIQFDRSVIRKRITKRLTQRLDNGMLDEVRQLLEQGLKPEQLTFYGLEYKYLTLHITGELSYDQMFEGLNTAIHQFAKRQMTWFRRMEKRGIRIHWITGSLPLDHKINLIMKTNKNNL